MFIYEIPHFYPLWGAYSYVVLHRDVATDLLSMEIRNAQNQRHLDIIQIEPQEFRLTHASKFTDCFLRWSDKYINFRKIH